MIDYTRDDFADGAHRYDLILDIAGNSTLRRCAARSPLPDRCHHRRRGRRLLLGGIGRQLRPRRSVFLRQRLTMFIAKQRSSDLERLTALIEAGQVTPSLQRTYPLSQAPEAIRHLESGLVRGKVAITLWPAEDGLA